MAQATGSQTKQQLWFIDNLAVVHVRGEETGGSWSLVQMEGRRGDMPPLHVHHTADEAFYVAEGRLTLFLAGGHEVPLSAGDCLLAPRGVPHAYRVESERARWLAICSPAGFERFVAAASVPAERPELPPGPPAVEPERLASLAAAEGIEILGPPGALPA